MLRQTDRWVSENYRRSEKRNPFIGFAYSRVLCQAHLAGGGQCSPRLILAAGNSQNFNGQLGRVNRLIDVAGTVGSTVHSRDTAPGGLGLRVLRGRLSSDQGAESPGGTVN